MASSALNFAGAVMVGTAIGSSMTIPARYRLALEHNRSINAGARGNWLNHRADGAAGAAKFAGSEVCGKTITALSGSATAQARRRRRTCCTPGSRST
ncbi:TPA: hypothetical protein RJR41_005846 [Burkholderia cenocepacia]|nr:hypothetical protein [Burkholderia cenocepacia]